MAEVAYSSQCKILKVDRKLGLVFGFGIICKERDDAGNLTPYFDHDRHGPEHIPDETMLEAAATFMRGSRVLGVEHEEIGAVKKAEEVPYGTVDFAFPLTESIAKSLQIQTHYTGLLIGVRPDSPETFERFASGELTGFSIAGERDEGMEQDPATGEWRNVKYRKALVPDPETIGTRLRKAGYGAQVNGRAIYVTAGYEQYQPQIGVVAVAPSGNLYYSGFGKELADVRKATEGAT
jgi:hypothetical protein